MIDYKEYTKLRDIAQKRVKRGQAAGANIQVNFPTVKELRKMGEYAREIEMAMLQQFIKTGFSLKRRREIERPKLSIEEKRERRREQSKKYRRNKVAKEYAREDYPTKYQEYLSGIETLNKKIKERYKNKPDKLQQNLIDIKPSQLPGFFAYMDYRFSQGSWREKKYVFDSFVDDYKKLLQKGYDPNQIVDDFKKFEKDQALLEDKAGGMSGMNYKKAQELWDQFIDDID